MAVYLLLLLALALVIEFHPKPPKEKEAIEMDLSMLELPQKQPKPPEPPKPFAKEKKPQKPRPKEQIEKPYTPKKQPESKPKPQPEPPRETEPEKPEPKKPPKPKKREKTPQLKKEQGGKLLVQKEQNATKAMKMPSLSQIGQALSKQQQKQKEQKQLDQAQRYLKNLYGQEYDELSKEQKEFLGTNLKTIGSVTQRHLNILGYPRVAQITRQNGTNIVEFTLYPSGDISGLKLVKRSGYSALDDHSIELIEVAHMDYPRPDSATTVRIKVIYNAFSQ